MSDQLVKWCCIDRLSWHLSSETDVSRPLSPVGLCASGANRLGWRRGRSFRINQAHRRGWRRAPRAQRSAARRRATTAKGRCWWWPARARARRASSPSAFAICWNPTRRCPANPSSALTFTDKAAGEMKHRVARARPASAAAPCAWEHFTPSATRCWSNAIPSCKPSDDDRPLDPAAAQPARCWRWIVTGGWPSRGSFWAIS